MAPETTDAGHDSAEGGILEVCLIHNQVVNVVQVLALGASGNQSVLEGLDSPNNEAFFFFFLRLIRNVVMVMVMMMMVSVVLLLQWTVWFEKV